MPIESNSESTSLTRMNGNDNMNGATDRKNSIDNTGNGNSGGGKLATMSYDPTPYIQRARVTRPAPPKPSCNPMQFVQIKPCNLYQTAQEQLKKAEEVKKVKEIIKEDPEEWQNNLDNWKSSRRKRVEHIIDRVVEVKKLELEEHDRTRRKSKTFSEMLEERGSRRTKLASLAVYTEDEANDLGDLGIATSSTSENNSVSEDYDNHSMMDDSVETEKLTENGTSNQNYETPSSTAPTNCSDSGEYTYEGAIQDYKTRISKTQLNGFNRNTVSSPYLKDSTPERNTIEKIASPRRMSGNRIENCLMNFEVKPNDQATDLNDPKKDLPKVDIVKRRELFEKDNNSTSVTLDETSSFQKRLSGDFTNTKNIRERLSSLEKKPNDEIKKANRLSGDITSLKDRLQNLERQTSVAEKSQKIDVPIVPLKDRLSGLHNAVTKEEIKKPVLLVDEHQLEMLKKEDIEKQKILKREMLDNENFNSSQEILNLQDESNVDTDREDSGIHTTDVSCSVSQTDEQPDLVNEEPHHHINAEDGLCQNVEQQSQNIVEIHKNCKESSSTCMPNAGRNLTMKRISSKMRQQQQTQQEQQVPDDSKTSTSPEPTVDQETSVEEALDMAFQAIDNENSNLNQNSSATEENKVCKNIQNSNFHCKETASNNSSSEPIYQNISKVNKNENQVETVKKFQKTIPKSEYQLKMTIQNNTQILSPHHTNDNTESYYQVPKSSEPLYEIPKNQKPVPVYENIEIFYPGTTTNGIEDSNNYPINSALKMEPPKEKPPPPPIEENSDNEVEPSGRNHDKMYDISSQFSASLIKEKDQQQSSNEESPGKGVKRMNSTKRIKKELRNKRSSFLGIEGNDDDTFLELTVAPPPDMAQLLQEERRLEKQLYMKAGLYESSDTADSRDSGVSENHSRQSSEPFTNSSEEHEDLLTKNEKEIIEVLEKEEKKQRTCANWSQCYDKNDTKIRCIEDQIREQEEVLRVERELLQLEQEELKRQRENLILRENLARKELAHGTKMLMSTNRRSLQDINDISTNYYANTPNQIYQVEADYRKSMSDLVDLNQKRIPPTPPEKPLRSYLHVDTRSNSNSELIKIASQPPLTTRIEHSQSTDDFLPLRNYQLASAIHHGNMTRHTLHALSATPKPKYTDGWVQANATKPSDKCNDTWLSYQQKRKSIPEGFNYNKHWLIQEAEQRRIDQQRGLRKSVLNGWGNEMNGSSAIQRSGSADNKPLPDAVIQTLTQRVQSKGIGERKRLDQPLPQLLLPTSSDSLLTTVSKTPAALSSSSSTLPEGQQDKILSVSGKKKCSHCGEELGRGAAMIIESLRLFYHINCFKCCVCHIQLGDGLNGTDVRVRNHKLHCHNCYSSDDGIKFSCV